MSSEEFLTPEEYEASTTDPVEKCWARELAIAAESLFPGKTIRFVRPKKAGDAVHLEPEKGGPKDPPVMMVGGNLCLQDKGHFFMVFTPREASVYIHSQGNFVGSPN